MNPYLSNLCSNYIPVLCHALQHRSKIFLPSIYCPLPLGFLLICMVAGLACRTVQEAFWSFNTALEASEGCLSDPATNVRLCLALEWLQWVGRCSVAGRDPSSSTTVSMMVPLPQSQQGGIHTWSFCPHCPRSRPATAEQSPELTCVLF